MLFLLLLNSTMAKEIFEDDNLFWSWIKSPLLLAAKDEIQKQLSRIADKKEIVINAERRSGKSWLCLWIALLEASHDKSVVVVTYGSVPTKKLEDLLKEVSSGDDDLQIIIIDSAQNRNINGKLILPKSDVVIYDEYDWMDNIDCANGSNKIWKIGTPRLQMSICPVLLLVGKQGSGKDSLADHLIHKYKQFAIEKISFAAPLKLMCRDLIKSYGVDLPIEFFYDPVEKEKERPPHLFKGKPLTIRAVLQHFGTETCRNFLGPDVWADAVMNKIVHGHSDGYIVSDCRFQNEVSRFQDRSDNFKTISLKITGRTSNPLSTHASEMEIDSMKTDYVYENTGTLEQLFEFGDSLFERLVR